MAINLKREGIALNAEERNKRNENLTIIEQELEKIGSASALAELAKLAADDAKVKTENVQQQVNALTVSGDSSPQAAQASIGADGTDYDGNLKARLDAEFNATAGQLADKVSKGQVTVFDIDKNKGLFDQTYMTSEFIQQMAGNTPVNAVIPPLGVTTVKTADKAMSPAKTTFFKISSNLINEKKVTPNTSITSTSNGALVETADYVVTDFIEIKPNTLYTGYRTARLAFYTADLVFISSTSALSWTTPLNAHYCRISIAVSFLGISAQLNIGSALLPFEKYYAYISKENIEKTEIPVIDTENTSFFEFSTNLLDKRSVEEKKIILSNTGVPTENQWHCVSDYIPVDSSNSYTVKGAIRVTYYDVNRVFTVYSNLTTPGIGFTFKPPVSAKWIRLSILTESLKTAQLNIGSELLPFENGGEYIKQQYIPKGENIVLINSDSKEELSIDYSNESFKRKIGNLFLMDSNIKKVFNANTVIPDSLATVMSYKSADINGLYDALMAKYPSYIKRTFLGYEASGVIPIYRYDFKPVRPSSEEPIREIKYFVATGTHPERAGVWAAYHTFRNICENWQDDELLEALRFNIHFIVVPIVSPWAYDNASRVNFNGVDINRNMPDNWTQGVEGYTWGGTNPLSEPETRYINQILLDNLDMLAFIDFHNFGKPTDGYSFIWCSALNNVTRTAGVRHIQKIDRKWKKDHTFMNQAADKFIGYVTKNATGGTLGNQANIYGIPGATTYEITGIVSANPAATDHDSFAMTMGYEAFMNYLLVLTDELLKVH